MYMYVEPRRAMSCEYTTVRDHQAGRRVSVHSRVTDDNTVTNRIETSGLPVAAMVSSIATLASVGG